MKINLESLEDWVEDSVIECEDEIERWDYKLQEAYYQKAKHEGIMECLEQISIVLERERERQELTDVNRASCCSVHTGTEDECKDNFIYI